MGTDGLARLRQLATGARRRKPSGWAENGSSAHFTVDRLYGDVPDTQLRLVTCGGNRTAGGYDSNLIVFAHRVAHLRRGVDHAV
ncbi:hypothetical protein OG285_09590 [Streptomyces sp. NBC_01471]|uniref:hypothetical protein n=1 Tax=Streptomyces sp. NBC_01471 TaxID=2903879 RepID=UPI00324387AC